MLNLHLALGVQYMQPLHLVFTRVHFGSLMVFKAPPLTALSPDDTCWCSPTTNFEKPTAPAAHLQRRMNAQSLNCIAHRHTDSHSVGCPTVRRSTHIRLIWGVMTHRSAQQEHQQQHQQAHSNLLARRLNPAPHVTLHPLTDPLCSWQHISTSRW